MKTRVILTQKNLIKRINDEIEFKKQLSDEDIAGNARCLGAISAYNDALDMTSIVSESTAETEEQQKCEYCHKGKHIELCNDSYLEMVPDETRICKKRDFDYEEWQLGTVKFSYCPMCGRKLS
ncbi:hypothetical protein [Liquorilactobacillus mali]|uniref:hypothetical protein n=1 Tax=Liquorilactobacillus mali TaxID=1618 RepID=UPI0023501529|nr:hypothetical protein [Liquorilactobacillus mali]MDC7953582.1 hypothetical protein [Liquorilactobacillus mali]